MFFTHCTCMWCQLGWHGAQAQREAIAHQAWYEQFHALNGYYPLQRIDRKPERKEDELGFNYPGLPQRSS